VHRRVFTYGTAMEADYHLEFLEARPGCFSHFQVHGPTGVLGPFELHVPGRHNALNATAAVAIAHQLGLAEDKIAAGVSSFRGVDRRFQIRGQARGITVVDDYGHHPTEIRATLAAAREFSKGRIHVVFQPHRYTRTRDLLDEFGAAFTDADSVFVLPIYAASEEPLPGITAELLTSKIASPHAQYAPDFSAVVGAVAGAARTGDMILTLGAGSVSQLGPQILAELESKS
jgi:UDP-N-acetylmuramate--alanine ligase